MGAAEKILVIKLEDLTGFVMALAAMARIRTAHPQAKITLLTTPAFGPLAKASGYFNAVDTSGEVESISLAKAIRGHRFARVYDLDQSAKTAQIYGLLWPSRPPWCGRGRLKARLGPDMHPLERDAALLQAAGIWPDAPTAPGEAPPPDLSWILRIAPSASRLKPYALLIPGGDGPRWPTSLFGELAIHFRGLGFDNVVIGKLEDGPLARQIQRYDPTVRDLTGRTDYAQLAVLSAKATLAVGNPCSALHLAVAAGAPTIAFYPAGANLMREGPRGHVAILQADQLDRIKVAQVARTAANLAPEMAMAG